MRSKRTKIEIKQDKSLIIKPLSQNHLKSRIFAFLRTRESLIENTQVLEGIVVKIFDSQKREEIEEMLHLQIDSTLISQTIQKFSI